MRFKFSGFTLLAIWLGAVAVAQTPTADQLNALKSLPKDQQDALLQNVLGNKGDGTGTKIDSKLSTPQTVEPKSDQSTEPLNKLNRAKTSDGRTLRQRDEDPELRAEDTVLIDLTPINRYKDINSTNPDGFNTGGNNSVTARHGSGSGVSGLSGISGGAANDGTVSGTRNNRNIRGNNNNDYGRVKADVKAETKPKTDEEKEKIEEKRQLILKNNPYHLN